MARSLRFPIMIRALGGGNMLHLSERERRIQRPHRPAGARLRVEPVVRLPGDPWVRVDTRLYSGYTTPPYYDSRLE